jgi:hypothetical protein
MRALLLLAVFLASRLASAAIVLDVGAGRTFTDLQAAVNACPATGCDIRIHDSSLVLPREVWIEGKSSLSILRSVELEKAGKRVRLRHSANLDPLSLAGTAIDPTDPLRPAGWRRWPNNCTAGPGGSKDTTNPYSTSGFQYNGMIAVVHSKDIHLEGLAFEGGHARQFENLQIWDCQGSIFFGNVGLNLFQSLRATVRECSFAGFHAALYVQGRNPQGALAIYPRFVSDPTERWTRPGEVGDHTVERNRFHGNTWAIFDEAEWDLPSTFRWNRAWRNFNRSWDSLIAAPSRTGTVEWSYNPGGFLMVRDVVRAVHRIHHNILWANPRVVGNGGWRAGSQHHFHDNLIGGFEDDSVAAISATNASSSDGMHGSFSNQLPYWSQWLDNNAIVLPPGAVRDTTLTRTWGNVRDSALCSGMYGKPTPSCLVTFDKPVTGSVPLGLPWPGASFPVGSGFLATVDGKTVRSADPGIVDPLVDGGWIHAFRAPDGRVNQILPGRNRWLRSVRLLSLDPASPNFLVPDTLDVAVRSGLMGAGSPRSATDSNDIGWPSGGRFLEPWGADHRERLSNLGSGCYGVSMVAGPGGVPAGAKWRRLTLWSLPWTDNMTVPNTEPLARPLKPLVDSTWRAGSRLNVCSDSAVRTNDAIRLDGVLEFNGTVSTLTSWVLGGTNINLPVSVSRASTRVRLSLHTSPGRLWIEGLDPESNVRILQLNGRVLKQGTASAGRFEAPRVRGILIVEATLQSLPVRAAFVLP